MQLVRFQLKRDTANDWASCNPVLLDGELGLESDTRKLKAGDGINTWNNLDYLNLSSEAMDIDLTGVVDLSVIYWNEALSKFVVDNEVTVKKIVDGGNF